MSQAVSPRVAVGGAKFGTGVGPVLHGDFQRRPVSRFFLNTDHARSDYLMEWREDRARFESDRQGVAMSGRAARLRDEILILEYRSGDKGALERLIRGWQPRVY